MKTFTIKAKNVWLAADLFTRVFSIVILLVVLGLAVTVLILDPFFALFLVGTILTCFIITRTIIGLLDAHDRNEWNRDY